MRRADRISVAYGAHRALEDVSLRVGPGEIVVILGAIHHWTGGTLP